MRVSYEDAPDVFDIVTNIVNTLRLTHIDLSRIKCMRSRGSRSEAIARIHGLPRIWQKALEIKPYYVIEVLSEKFDNLPYEGKIKVLLHELLHIPKTFSGGLRSHGRYVNSSLVDKLYREYISRRIGDKKLS